MKRVFLSLVCIFAASLIAEMAMAERALSQHFGATDSCYARQYSPQHLAKNPEQTVSFIRLDHSPNAYDLKFEPETGMVIFDLTIRFKDAAKNYEALGECHPKDGILKCGIECDGGQFSIKSKDADSILLYNGGRMVFSDCDAGDVNYRELTDQTDDKIFLLHRLPDDQCSSANN